MKGEESCGCAASSATRDEIPPKTSAPPSITKRVLPWIHSGRPPTPDHRRHINKLSRTLFDYWGDVWARTLFLLPKIFGYLWHDFAAQRSAAANIRTGKQSGTNGADQPIGSNDGKMQKLKRKKRSNSFFSSISWLDCTWTESHSRVNTPLPPTHTWLITGWYTFTHSFTFTDRIPNSFERIKIKVNMKKGNTWSNNNVSLQIDSIEYGINSTLLVVFLKPFKFNKCEKIDLKKLFVYRSEKVSFKKGHPTDRFCIWLNAGRFENSTKQRQQVNSAGLLIDTHTRPFQTNFIQWMKFVPIKQVNRYLNLKD